MTTRSSFHNQWYRFVSSLLCITVLLSSQPAGSPIFAVRSAYATSSETEPASIPANMTNSPFMEALQQAGLSKSSLAELGVIGLDGQPTGMLMDIGAMEQSPAQHEPASLASPISISRVQSAYAGASAVNNTLVVTFTVTNNQPPASVPQLPDPDTATITETIEIVSKVDFSNDPNTIHNVLLVDTLTEDSTFVRSYPVSDRSGSEHAGI
jgi:hypothetical protein